MSSLGLQVADPLATVEDDNTHKLESGSLCQEYLVVASVPQLNGSGPEPGTQLEPQSSHELHGGTRPMSCTVASVGLYESSVVQDDSETGLGASEVEETEDAAHGVKVKAPFDAKKFVAAHFWSHHEKLQQVQVGSGLHHHGRYLHGQHLHDLACA